MATFGESIPDDPEVQAELVDDSLRERRERFEEQAEAYLRRQEDLFKDEAEAILGVSEVVFECR